MVSQRFLSAIGATALGAGIMLGSGGAIQAVYAQETTPAVDAPAQAAEAGSPEEFRAQAYNSFLSSLASELNVDETAVDDAIRTALKQQVAEQETAGNLDAGQATELQTMIDESEAPLMLGMGGPGGFRGRGEMHGFMGRGGEHSKGRGGFIGRVDDKDVTREEPEDEESSASLPSSDEASDQSTPADAPAVETTSS